MTTTKPQKVDFFSDTTDDMEVIVLGAMGFSTKMIRSRVGLTDCQITYRLHKAGVRRSDYRNGESEMSGIIRQNTSASITSVMFEEMRRKFG